MIILVRMGFVGPISDHFDPCRIGGAFVQKPANTQMGAFAHYGNNLRAAGATNRAAACSKTCPRRIWQ